MIIYTCTKCHKDKPETEFHAWKGNKRGRRPECRECMRIWQEQYNIRRRLERATNPDRRAPKLGEKAPNYKLTYRDCENIRALREGGMKLREIADKYEIHWNTAWQIAKYHARALA